MSLARELCLLEVSVARELCLLPARQRLPQMESQSANELRKREKRLEAREELVFLCARRPQLQHRPCSSLFMGRE